jgi:hypothetical protein
MQTLLWALERTGPCFAGPQMKNGAGRTGATGFETDPLTAGRAKRNAEESSYLGS